MWDDEADPCTVYVAMEHSSGCPEMDFTPVLDVLGALTDPTTIPRGLLETLETCSGHSQD